MLNRVIVVTMLLVFASPVLAAEDASATLRLELDTLKSAAKKNAVELDRLRGENKNLTDALASAQKKIDALTARLEKVTPAKKIAGKLTDKDLVPSTFEAAGLRGKELLLDGFVVSVEGKDNQFRAVIAAGTLLKNRPVMVRSEAATTASYQVQAIVAGERAAQMTVGDQIRVRGIIRVAEMNKGTFWTRTGLGYGPSTGTGTVIAVQVDPTDSSKVADDSEVQGGETPLITPPTHEEKPVTPKPRDPIVKPPVRRVIH